MSGKSSRDKGARGELQAAAALRALGIYAERSGRLGLTAGDLLHGCHGCHLEVKYQSNPSLWKAMRQAELDSRGLLIPVVLAKMVGKRGSSDWMVMHKLDDWPSVVASFAAARAKGLPPDA
jgi:hypothetical protein